MEMSPEAIEKLIQKYIEGNCDEKESAVVEAWYNELADQPHNILQAEIDCAEETLLGNIKTYIGSKKHIKLWPRIAIAASIVICIGIGFYFYKNYDASNPIVRSQHDIAPGGNKAFLTLADGKRITLTDIKNGEIAEQSGVKITKATDGQLIYTVSNLSENNNKVKEYNTIETPNGGQYQLKLPDGTKVWLNAASSLKFPTKFARLVNRRVELLRGEAYFEVAKDKKHPFIVKADQQEVEVLGTHFNINSYANELGIKTTLLEGSVKVVLKGSSKTLLPGEQSQISKSNISVVRNIDLEDVIAWKNGYFKFGESLESIMNKVSRWYDVDIIYQIKPNSGTAFNGKISRNRSLRELLDMLEFAGNVHFKIEGRRVIVQK